MISSPTKRTKLKAIVSSFERQEIDEVKNRLISVIRCQLGYEALPAQINFDTTIGAVLAQYFHGVVLTRIQNSGLTSFINKYTDSYRLSSEFAPNCPFETFKALTDFVENLCSHLGVESVLAQKIKSELASRIERFRKNREARIEEEFLLLSEHTCRLKAHIASNDEEVRTLREDIQRILKDSKQKETTYQKEITTLTDSLERLRKEHEKLTSTVSLQAQSLNTTIDVATYQRALEYTAKIGEVCQSWLEALVKIAQSEQPIRTKAQTALSNIEAIESLCLEAKAAFSQSVAQVVATAAQVTEDIVLEVQNTCGERLHESYQAFNRYQKRQVNLCINNLKDFCDDYASLIEGQWFKALRKGSKKKEQLFVLKATFEAIKTRLNNEAIAPAEAVNLIAQEFEQFVSENTHYIEDGRNFARIIRRMSSQIEGVRSDFQENNYSIESLHNIKERISQSVQPENFNGTVDGISNHANQIRSLLNSIAVEVEKVSADAREVSQNIHCGPIGVSTPKQTLPLGDALTFLQEQRRKVQALQNDQQVSDQQLTIEARS